MPASLRPLMACVALVLAGSARTAATVATDPMKKLLVFCLAVLLAAGLALAQGGSRCHSKPVM